MAFNLLARQENEIKELESKLITYCDSYYNESISLISDEDFDKLKTLYEKKSGKKFVMVGSTPTIKFAKEKHLHPMLSLEKLNTPEDLIKWVSGKYELANKIVIDWKLDGVSLSSIYRYGHLIKLVTRGNGVEGDNVTHNASSISNLPTFVEDLKEEPYIEIRGEVVISKKNFLKLQSENPEFVSARNTASGSLKLKDNKESKKRYLELVAYYIYNSDGMYCDIDEGYKYLNDWGFTIPDWSLAATSQSLEDYKYNIEIFEENRKEYPYQTDGLVIKVNSLKIINQLGSTSHHPKSAVAYKFKAEESWTVLEEVEWGVSSTGRINPVGILKPVQIGDVVVSRVSLHNLDIMDALNIKVGSEVLVKRANDVIPMITKTVETENSLPITIPNTCPVCGAAVKRDDQYVYCTNIKCSAVLKDKILKFSNLLGVKGIGDSIADKLANCMLKNGMPDNHYDYYSIIDSSYEFWSFITDSSVIGKKIYDEIQKAKEDFTDSKALASLFIEGIGLTVAERITEIISFKELWNKKPSDFEHIDGIGNILAFNLSRLSYDYKDAYLYFCDRIVEKKIIKDSNKLNGLSFCITGTLDKPRYIYEDLIEKNGGSLAGVSKKLSYLIVGDAPGSKLQKAVKLGTQILNCVQFMELLNG